jgi:hypothetical protein
MKSSGNLSLTTRARLERNAPKIQIRALQLRDAEAFDAVLAKHQRTAVMFGHLHAGFVAVRRGSAFIAAPSTAYGDLGDPTAPDVTVYGFDRQCRAYEQESVRFAR